jgi:oligopeptide transport system permease protein
LKNDIKNETLTINGKTIKTHDRRYILGTDSLGRDLLSRVIYGGRISIIVGTLGAFTAVFIGVLVGAIAGYIGGAVDNLIMRFVEVVYSLPFVLLVIIFMSMFGRSMSNIFFGIALISWLDPARIVRGQIISLKSADFVDAARSIGASNGRIILRHMIPNVLGLIIVFVTLQVPVFIILESTLSFLGLGISPPLASWGTLLNEAVEGMTLYPRLLFYPSLAMVVFMFSINFLGDGLRDAFDPQSKNRL